MMKLKNEGSVLRYIMIPEIIVDWFVATYMTSIQVIPNSGYLLKGFDSNFYAFVRDDYITIDGYKFCYNSPSFFDDVEKYISTKCDVKLR